MTLDRMLREFQRAYEENDKPAPPVWLNSTEINELYMNVHYTPQNTIPWDHGDWVGTIYGLEVHYCDDSLPRTDHNGNPYINRVDIQWLRGNDPKTYAKVEQHIMKAYSEGRVR